MDAFHYHALKTVEYLINPWNETQLPNVQWIVLRVMGA